MEKGGCKKLGAFALKVTVVDIAQFAGIFEVKGQHKFGKSLFLFQIEQAMDTICTFAVEMRTALEQVISSSSNGDKSEKHDRHKKGHVTDVLGKSLRNVSG